MGFWGVKVRQFWIFTEISKCEQLYLLFTSINISVFMLVWKSSGCSLKKYLVLCTHIIVIECYSFSKIDNNSKNSYFFILLHFQHPPYCTKARLICLKNGFLHSIPSMSRVSRNRDIRTSPFWSYEELTFEKSSEAPNFSTFSIFQMKYFFWFQKFRK